MLDVALLAIPKRVLITSLIDDRYKYNQGFNGFYKAVYNYYFRPATLWLPGKMEFRYKASVKKCLTNRGHSVLD